MSPETYKTALKEAKKELADAIADLGETEQKVSDLNERIADLRQTVTVLSKLCGEVNVEVEDALGLTDAIRKSFEETPNQTMAAQDVRLRLESRGFQTRRYGNLLASIHTVINRLEAKNEIRKVGVRNDGKPAYQWVPHIPPPPSMTNSTDWPLGPLKAKK